MWGTTTRENPAIMFLEVWEDISKGKELSKLDGKNDFGGIQKRQFLERQLKTLRCDQGKDSGSRQGKRELQHVSLIQSAEQYGTYKTGKC